MPRLICSLLVLALIALPIPFSLAQEQSVKPGINDTFRDPDVKTFQERFEVESREPFARRKEIVAACDIESDATVADIGAGTGLFTRMFSDVVGKDGRVIAVDIAQKFLDHIEKTSREAGRENVTVQLAKPDSAELPPNSVDVAFICDTYHHFEFPLKTMASVHRALKPGGRVILIDFRRVPGQSTDWVLNHVRAGQEVFEAEIVQSGFRKAGEEQHLLKENYFVVFEKPAAASIGARMRRGFGPGPAMRADQEVFHYLLEHHADIRRTVKTLDNGVETVTESDKPEVAAKIQDHVTSMHKRVTEGHGLRFWDELFVAIFRNYAAIQMTVEKTEKGVRVKETSENPAVVKLIRAHAEVVSGFVANGFDEAHKNHPVPAAAPETGKTSEASRLVFPIVAGYGGIVVIPNAVDRPRTGAKVVFDVTADAKPGDVNKGLERAARLLNLYGAYGMKASDVTATIVLHGDATKSVLNDAAYQSRFMADQNPNLPLIRELRKSGVEVLVCGQALHYKKIPDSEVADNIAVAAAALTVVTNRQLDGYSYVPVP